ncbi:unnamed protein product [Schistosoma rodhaini]|nr:unnamed protein product [Schistosoma rodhaini]
MTEAVVLTTVSTVESATNATQISLLLSATTNTLSNTSSVDPMLATTSSPTTTDINTTTISPTVVATTTTTVSPTTSTTNTSTTTIIIVTTKNTTTTNTTSNTNALLTVINTTVSPTVTTTTATTSAIRNTTITNTNSTTNTTIINPTITTATTTTIIPANTTVVTTTITPKTTITNNTATTSNTTITTTTKATTINPTTSTTTAVTTTTSLKGTNTATTNTTSTTNTTNISPTITTATTTTTVKPTTNTIISNTSSGITYTNKSTTNTTSWTTISNTTNTITTTNTTSPITTNSTTNATTTSNTKNSTTTISPITTVIGIVSPVIKLPSFEDDTGPKPIELPVPKYELPNEDLVDVRYENTANHYWSFKRVLGKSFIFDRAPDRNILTRSIYDRLSFFDSKLSTAGPIYNDLNNMQKTLFKSLNGTLPEGRLTSPGIHKTQDSIYINSNENESCICLLDDITRERYYFKQCLLDINECDYGLSLSVWLQFTTETFSPKEVLISTAPEKGKGFSLSINNGMLQFELRTADTLWKVSSPITKTLNQWINIGVAWGKSAQNIKLVINGKIVAVKNNYQGVQYLGSNSTPTSIWVGCDRGFDGEKIASSVNPGIRVVTVALWYWPIQLNELFSGGLEHYLLTEKVSKPLVPQPVKITNYADYTNEVEELIPDEQISESLNPIYLMADYYNPLLVLPLNYIKNDIELVADRSGLKTAYQLTSNRSCFEMKLFNVKTCPGNISLCVQGLSMGVWLKIPDILSTTVGILDILELVNGTTVSVYNNYINIFINSTKGIVVFRVYSVVPKDIWFNIGISLSNFIDPTVAVYFNGIPMPVEQVSPPTRTPLQRTDRCLNGLILGSSKIEQSAAGITYNDFILWYRWLYSFESHVFVGYTRAQQANLHNASYYWTPDPYIAYDSNVQIQVRQKYKYLQPQNDYSLTSIPGYSLASIYHPKFVTFHFSQDDYENKSKVPIFEMKPKQYMMLGQRKSSEVISTNLIWTGKCLIEPSLSACNAHGFSISIWIKLLTVSQNRLRFYLNSGDGGTSLSAMSNYRGISKFTDTSLIGVTISQLSLTWQLVLDSSSYKIGQWINIGILWRGDVGLTLLLDGVNYGSVLSNGQKVYKPRESPPYLVLGRYDTDHQTTWLSPSDADYAAKQNSGNEPQWEMSHYALGDIAYFNRLLSHKEYNEQNGLLGNPYLRNILGHVWFGRNMISPPISQIMEAVSRNISKPGPILNGTVSSSVLLLRNPEAIQLSVGGSLRLGTFKGLSIGGWYRFGGYLIKPTDLQIEPIILFTGFGGNYGLTISYNGALLGGWLQYNIIKNNIIIQNYWLCIADNLKIGLNQYNMQWIHFSFIWGINKINNNNNNNDNVLQLLINGLIIIECNKNIPINNPLYQKWINKAINKSINLFNETNTNKQSFLLISSKTLDPIQQIQYSISLLSLQSKYLTLNNLMNLIGIEYYEIIDLLYSTFYWKISGLYNQLTTNRIQSSNAYYGHDQYNNPNSALCTEGNNLSYIIFNGDKINHYGDMTNLYESCLYDPSICKRYSLSLRFIIMKLPNELNGYYEILRTIPINNGIKTIGLRIYLSLDQNDIIIEIRSQYLTYKYTIKLDLIQQPGKWINMQIFYYQDHPLTISIDGNTNLSNENGTIINEINSKLSTDERLKQNVIIGRGLKMCISSMTLYDISNENDFDLLVNTVNSQICYTNMDMFEELKGSMNDYKNRTNYASRLENFIRPLLFPSISCIQNPDICSNNGMTMSMWIMINGFVNEEGKNLDVKNNENLTAIILSTGPLDNSGILIQVSVDSNNALELGQWTNIAFSWFSQPEENSGSLEIYINGLRKQSSTIPTSMLNMNTELNDTSKVFIGSAYYNVNKNTTNSVNKVFATGGIANLAYWESKDVISCSKPRKTKKFLLGDCESDTDVPETVTCIMMQGCRQVDGLVCMDRTLPNLIQMASQANKLIYPSDFIKVLQISVELLQIYKPHQTTPTTTDNHNDISFGLNIISSTMNIIHSWYKVMESFTNINDQFIINEIILLKQNIHYLITNLINLLLSTKFQLIWLQLINDHYIKYNKLLSELNYIFLFISKINNNQYNQLNSYYIINKLKYINNPITLNISYPTNTGNEMYHSQFQIKTNDQQNIQLNGALTILSILNNNNNYTTENLKIIDIPLDKFSSNVTHYQQNYIDNEQKDSYTTTTTTITTTSQLEIPLVFLIASPLYSVEFYTENHSYTTIQINYTIPLLRLNKYSSVYYYETTWRMKWMAYNAEKYNQGLLANEIRCVYWDDQLDTNGAWNTNGCQIIKSTKTHVQCSCNHLSSFAVAMESEDAPYRNVPIWKAWGTKSESECTMLMNIIIFGGNGLSLTCSLIFILTLIIVWKKASIPDVCLTRMGLCLCQIGFHATLLIEPLMNQYQIPCQAIGVSLNLFAILVSSWLSNEAISLFKSFVLGQLKLTYCWTWITGIVIPVSLVLIPAVVSKLNPQGDDLLCLPAHESLEFWIMFGSIFAYTIINIMVCFTLTCNIETPAFLSPKILDRLLTRVKKLNSLLLYYIITWSLLFVVIQFAIPYVVFVAFALASLQGTWSFVIYGLEDRELFKACLRNTQKQRRSDNILETNKLSTDPVIKNTEKDELHIIDQSSHHYNSTAVSQQHQDTRNDTRILQRNKSNKKDIE